jgi:hypothetical protein
MNYKRNQRGSAIALGTALALAIIVLGCGFLAWSLYMGGQQEAVNAVDAGALNIGRQILDDKSKIGTKLNLADPSEQCFFDVTSDVADPAAFPSGAPNPDGIVTLRRINRVWAEAMLMAVNADAAGSSNMRSNADQAAKGAQQINDRLQANLTKPSNLYDWFTNFADANSVRMLGKNSTVSVVPGNNWQTSFMMQGTESNISLNGAPPNFSMPPGYTFDSSFVTKTQRQLATGQNLYFLKGYTPLKIGDKTFWQVPFQYDQKPHLVALSTFSQGQQSGQSGQGYSNPVPNAYAVEGKAGNATGLPETSVARVLTNPREPFQLSIPHGFIHIKVDQMQSNWWFFPLGIPVVYDAAQENYGFIPEMQSGLPMPGGGVLCSMVYPNELLIGSEVAFADIQRDIYDYPTNGDQSAVDNILLNRVNEMITVPGKTITDSELMSCLHNSINTAALIGNFKDFYIFSPDGQSIQCLPQAAVIANYPLMAAKITNDPDGENTKILSDPFDEPGVPPIPPIPIVTPAPFCTPTPGANWEWSTVHKEIWWQPGTGYNGNLGQLEIKRWTEVYTLGVCNPV